LVWEKNTILNYNPVYEEAIVVEEDGISVQLSSLETSILLLCFS